MRWRNSIDRYGLAAILFHWLIALGVIGLFSLGVYMVDLDYYDTWYHRGPELHKSVGIILAVLLGLRLVWRWTNPRPRIIGANWEVRAAKLVHGLLYLLLAGVVVSGYFIASGDGHGIAVFNWFEVPAWVLPIENQEDIAGEIHEVLAWCLVVLATAHTLAALKHHFIDRDTTLLRMVGRG